MTKDKDKALKQALEYVDLVPDDRYNAEHIDREALVTDIKEALAQPEQEPWATREDFYLELDRRVERIRKEMEIKTVTMRCKDYDIALQIIDMHFGHVFVGQVSTTPQRPWVGLTDEDRAEIAAQGHQRWKEYAEAIEARLKELNTCQE